MKSFILSFLLTAIVCGFFMSVVDTTATAFINKIPNWVFIVLFILFFAGYLLALYWGVTGIFKEQRLLNFLGIGFSLLGVGIYVFGYVMDIGKGKESPGQFDHELSKIETNQRTALYDLLRQTNTKAADVQFVAYWGMNKNPNNFVLCVQEGNIIALQIKNKIVTDVKSISKLNQLNWLVLENCNLKSISDLKLPELQRLTIDHNQLTSLAGFENTPKVGWLNFRNNPITDSTALKDHPNKELYIENE